MSPFLGLCCFGFALLQVIMCIHVMLLLVYFVSLFMAIINGCHIHGWLYLLSVGSVQSFLVAITCSGSSLVQSTNGSSYISRWWYPLGAWVYALGPPQDGILCPPGYVMVCQVMELSCHTATSSGDCAEPSHTFISSALLFNPWHRLFTLWWWPFGLHSLTAQSRLIPVTVWWELLSFSSTRRLLPFLQTTVFLYSPTSSGSFFPLPLFPFLSILHLAVIPSILVAIWSSSGPFLDTLAPLLNDTPQCFWLVALSNSYTASH